jgi:6-pyruvoyl-tetrahydropterin synthase
MRYVRRFTFSAAHFSTEEAYARLERARNIASLGDWKNAFDHLLAAARDTHGHDFVVTITVERDDAGMVVDDDVLESVIAPYRNVHLSLLDRYRERRALTENIALDIRDDVLARVDTERVTVVVEETPCIRAEVGP